MSPSPAFLFSAAGLGVIAVGAALWMRFADAVYLDTLAANLIGCLF